MTIPGDADEPTMHAVPWITADVLPTLLTVSSAADVLVVGLRSAPPLDEQMLRSRLSWPSGELLVMPAVHAGYCGVKLVGVPTAASRNYHGVQGAYLLFDGASLQLKALIDGAALTALRTPAMSLLVTQRLAAPDSCRLTVFGTGPQAWGHVLAMRSHYALDSVQIVGRDETNVNRFVTRCCALGIPATASTAEKAVPRADIICTCSSSNAPLFDGRLLLPHAHVNAVGSHTATSRELDDRAIAASQVVVESRQVALAEAGELIIPIQAGIVSEAVIRADLQELLSGAEVVEPAELTVFKSVGFGLADLIVAAEAYERYNAVSANG